MSGFGFVQWIAYQRIPDSSWFKIRRPSFSFLFHIGDEGCSCGFGKSSDGVMLSFIWL